MRRPKFWLRNVLCIGLLLVIGQYVLLTWVVPAYGPRLIERIVGDSVTVDAVRLSPPLTTTLTGLRLGSNTSEVALTIQRLIVRPRWLSLASKTLWIEEVVIDQPILRLSRTNSGMLRWPTLSAGGPVAGDHLPAWLSSWQVDIASVNIENGVVEFVDEKLATPFHGILDHVSLNLGPISGPIFTPLSASRMSFALVGQVVGDAGHAAPLYCSGWLDLFAKNLQSSCRLEPLALAAFEPYYHGPPEVRVYATTVSSTSQWSARLNDLTARIQLVLGHLHEGDVSVHGRNIFDVKRLGTGPTNEVSGEITITGMLDHPSAWQAVFLPGDGHMQHLVERLQEAGVKLIRVAFIGHPLYINIAPTNQPIITDVAAATKEVQEALEILAAPVVEEAPPREGAVVTEAPSQAPAAPTETPSIAPSSPVVIEGGTATPVPPAAQPLAPSTSPEPARSAEPSSSVHP